MRISAIVASCGKELKWIPFLDGIEGLRDCLLEARSQQHGENVVFAMRLDHCPQALLNVLYVAGVIASTRWSKPSLLLLHKNDTKFFAIKSSSKEQIVQWIEHACYSDETECAVCLQDMCALTPHTWATCVQCHNTLCVSCWRSLGKCPFCQIVPQFTGEN